MALGLASEKVVCETEEPEASLQQEVETLTTEKISAAIFHCVETKMAKKDRERYFEQIKTEVLEQCVELSLIHI